MKRPTRGTSGVAAAVVVMVVMMVVAAANLVWEDGDQRDESTTVSDTTITVAPTTTVAPITTPEPADSAPSGDFVETFTGNSGLERFRTGVFHRDVDAQGWGNVEGSWPVDHDVHQADCGPPHTHQHIVTKADRAAAVFVCRDHLMTAMGHVDSYSIVWFSPDQEFSDQTTVSWDVNATDIGTRQWWEVAIVPANAPDHTCLWWLPCSVPAYPDGAVVIGNGHGGPNIYVDGSFDFLDWRSLCNANALDPEGCASKAIRRPWSIADNGDGTLTVKFHTYTWTTTGSFPDAPFKVVFKDHNYTPNKDGIPQGYTWHWDSIAVS